MTADLFLTCFLACLFAFVVFGVLGYQIVGYLLKRAVEKNLPEIISKMLHGGTGDSETREALAELASHARYGTADAILKPDREVDHRVWWTGETPPVPDLTCYHGMRDDNGRRLWCLRCDAPERRKHFAE